MKKGITILIITFMIFLPSCGSSDKLSLNVSMREEMAQRLADIGAGGWSTITPYVYDCATEGHREKYIVTATTHKLVCSVCGEELSAEQPHEASAELVDYGFFIGDRVYTKKYKLCNLCVANYDFFYEYSHDIPSKYLVTE